MGFFKRLALALGWVKQSATIIVVGLDDSGKTTLINFLKPRKSAALDVVPTVGFSQERFEKGKLRFNVFDMSGAGTYRSLWETYYRDVQAVIFVVDSTDKLRMCVAKDELQQMLNHQEIKAAATLPVLFFANKQDLPSALEVPDVCALLDLQGLMASKPWHIQQCTATTGEGVGAGIEWLVQQLVGKGASPAHR